MQWRLTKCSLFYLYMQFSEDVSSGGCSCSSGSLCLSCFLLQNLDLQLLSHTVCATQVCATLSVIDALLYHISSRPTTSIQIFHRDKTQTQCYIRRASHPTASIQICIYPPNSPRSPIAVSTFSQKINLQIVNWRFFADPSQVSQVFVSDVI